MISQTLTNPNSPSVLPKTKLSSAADCQMLPPGSSDPLATPKTLLSLQSETTDSPSGPTAPLQREGHPVLGKAGKSLGFSEKAPAHTVTVCLSVNISFTGSPWRLSKELQILTLPETNSGKIWQILEITARDRYKTIPSVQENRFYSKEEGKQQQFND